MYISQGQQHEVCISPEEEFRSKNKLEAISIILKKSMARGSKVKKVNRCGKYLLYYIGLEQER